MPRESEVEIAVVDDGWSTSSFLKSYWLPILLGILAVVFIVQNRGVANIQFLMVRVAMPEWLLYCILMLVGLVIGWYSHRRRIKRRAGL